MSELPKGWEIAKLGQYIYLKNGYAFKSNDYVESNEKTVPVIRISDIDGEYASDKKSNHIPEHKAVLGFEVMVDDLLVAMSGATTGKIGIYKGNVPAFQNQRVGNFKLIVPEFGDLGFRNHLIRYLSPTILDMAYGGAQPNISASGIENIDFPLPPLAEQKRIVEKLDQVLAQVGTIKARLDGIPAILKRFRQSVLAAAVSGKLTEEWRGKNPTFQSAHLLINKVCISAFDGPFGSKLKTADYTENGVRVVRLENIGHLEFYDDKKTFVSFEKYETLKRNTLIEGDILFSSFVDEETRVCVFRFLDGIFVNKADCFCLRPDPSYILSDFLAFMLASHSSYSQIKDRVQGITRPRVNLKILKSLSFNIPSLEEQTEIVRLVDQYFAFADTIEKQVQKAQQRVDKLTQSILAKAFRGELVPQDNPLDEGYEPADQLLKRIAAARAESEALAKAAKKVGKRKNSENQHN